MFLSWFEFNHNVISGGTTTTTTTTSSLSTANNILSFSNFNQSSVATIGSNTIVLNMPVGDDLSSLIYNFQISPYATAKVSGVTEISGITYTNNLGILGYNLKPQIFTVTAQAGNVKNYTISAQSSLNNPVTYIGQTIVNTSGSIIDIEDIRPTTPTNVFVLYNSITSNTTDHFILIGNEDPTSGQNNMANGAIVMGNYFNFTGSLIIGSQENEAVFIGHNINSLIKYNFILNGQYNLDTKASGYINTRGATAYNVLTGGWSVGAGFKGICNGKCYNNTFYNSNPNSSVGAVYINSNTDNGQPGFPATGTTIYNNIFYSVNTTGRFIYVDQPSLLGFVSDYNIFYCPNGSASGSAMFRIAQQPSGSNDYTFTQWQALGYDIHSVWMNPKFINTTYCIPSSPLYYATPLKEFALGLSTGATWTVGIAPATIYQGSKWQNGAYIVPATGGTTTTTTTTIAPTTTTTTTSGLIQLSTNTLVVTAVSSSQINLSWNNDPNATSYHIYWNTTQAWDGGSGWNYLGNFTGTTTTQTGLSADTTYYYQEYDHGNGITYTTSLAASAHTTTMAGSSTTTTTTLAPTTTTTTTQSTGGFQVYNYTWNNVGSFVNSVWSPGINQYDNPLISNNTNGSQSTPPLTYGGSSGWACNQGYNGNSIVSNVYERYSGQYSLDLILNPFNPSIPSGVYNQLWPTTTPGSNDRCEIFLTPFSDWIQIGTEVWTSWSFYYPYLSSVLDPSPLASSGYFENVIRQWSPIGTDAGPQQYLLVNPGYNGGGVGNNVLYNSEAWNSTYYYANSTTNGGSYTANSLNYGHIVPGVWMDFVEHTIIDDGTNNNGCYQLWVTIPTVGLPNNGSTPDCYYKNFGGTYLWFNFNASVNPGFKTTRVHTPSGGGVSKFGLYNSGWLQTSTSYGTASQAAMQAVGNNTNGGQMECFVGPIKMEFNTGTINYGTVYNTLSGNITSYYIDPYGQQHIQP